MIVMLWRLLKMKITTMTAHQGKMTIKTLDQGVLNIKIKTIFEPQKGVTKYGLEKML